jgi:hypothetical protein
MTLTVTTAIGDLDVYFVDGRRARVTTPNGKPVTLGVREYSVDASFHLADGRWQHTTEKMAEALRPWGLADASKPVPPTFLVRAVEAARGAVETALREDPALQHAAAVRYAEAAVNRARGNVAKLREELADEERALAEAEAQLLAAHGGQAS